ncbi:cytochrome P450 714B3-like [Phalaenopsis equestris]|uniref:cytochrome P450 714B3-like n=1 Tax=Phalaenopsis equestris TaxID=78828 RepID=UPI0009E5FE9D|nr:cytochrome P450 714B3-like [Phalaenopsis equestris]
MCSYEEGEGRVELAMEALLYALVLLLCGLALHFYYNAWIRPERIRRKLRLQGIGGPPPAFLHGNLKEVRRFVGEEKGRRRGGGEEKIRHDYSSALFPYFDRWRSMYGPIFLYTMGNVPMLHVSHPELVREMNLCKSLDLGKATYLKRTHEPLFGHGILKSNGDSWTQQRKIIAPEFFMDKVKGMVELMVDSAMPLLRTWERRVEDGGGTAEINIDEDLKSYSADVISRASFGSSYSKGKQIFLKLYELKKAVSKPNLLLEITGIRHIPTKSNREVWKLNKEIRSLILEVVREGSINEGRCSPENNLLRAILRSTTDAGGGDAEDFVVDNCKNIYFAGHETTAVAATWCLLLLALHPEWQERTRAEVKELCAGRSPDANSLLKMKTLTMVIQEVLRLYPPGPVISREALRDIKLGTIQLPKGINIFIPVPTMHQNHDTWGADAYEFNPKRFEHGVTGACRLPQTYLPFGAGPRTCLGQNFAMVELKIVLALILIKFSFVLSPNYKHSPMLRLIVEPEHGVGLIVKKV